MWPFKRCLHIWRVLDKTVIPGAKEIENAHLLMMDDEIRAAMALTRDSVMVLVVCDKCGKLDRSDA